MSLEKMRSTDTGKQGKQGRDPELVKILPAIFKTPIKALRGLFNCQMNACNLAVIVDNRSWVQLINRSYHMHTNINNAIDECGPGHPAHVQAPISIGNRCGRIVAIRVGNKPDTYNLTFSDPKVDLRKAGDTLCNVPAAQVVRKIDVFLGGSRVHMEQYPWFDQFINQASRECEVKRLTPTRCRIEYELPNSGVIGAWRYQTTVGGFTYVAEW